MALYGIFYGLFDKYIWKWNVLRRFSIVRIPNLTGTWSGEVRPVETPGISSGLRVATEITITIRQSWTTISVNGQTRLSNSHSLSGSLLTDEECSLSYEYVNEPSPAASTTMHTHRGVARLSLNNTCTEFDGEYYSGRDRQNIGTIHLKRS
jgi:hypothetical protein